MAQETQRQGVPWTGEPGKRESVKDIMDRERAQGPRQPPSRTHPRGSNPNTRIDNPDSPRVSQWPPAGHADSLPDAVVDPNVGFTKMLADRTVITPLMSPVQTGTKFQGPTSADSGYVPPDSMGAVGPTQIMVVINGRVRTYKKDGTQDFAIDTDTDTFFGSVCNCGGSTFTSDPRVVFDSLSQSWFISMINTQPAPNRVMIAVSNSPIITARTNFTFYHFVQNQPSVGVGSPGGPTADDGLFADYPSLGVDNNALYIGVNMYSGQTYQSATGFVINKANLLLGTLTVTAFRQIGTNLGNIFSPLGVTNMDPNATEGYFIGPDFKFFGTLRMRRITNPGSTPAISGTLTPPNVPATADPIPVPAQGSTKTLSPIGDRLMNARILNGSLWTTHSIEVDSTGVPCVPSPCSTGGRNGMRFYQINNLTATPTLVQAGTLFDSSLSNPLFYWAGSIAATGQGNAILASSYAGQTAFAGVAYAGIDQTGTISSPSVVIAGGGAYNPGDASNPYRWGDFSNAVVDPADNMTIWSFQEYSVGPSWGIEVAQYKAPPPAGPLTVSPVSAPAGATTSLTITGSGFYDPGPGFPNHISATVSGGGDVTVNSVTYTSPTQITLSVTIAANAAVTARTVTVTNPDGQSVSTPAILTVALPQAVTLSPSGGTLPTGTTTVQYSHTITASGGAAPYNFTIFAGNLPAGLSLNASSSTTAIISGTPTTSGTETFTVQATDKHNITGITQYTLTIRSLATTNFSITVNSRSYDPTAFPPYAGRYTVNTTLTNNGPATSSSAIYLQITALNYNSPPPGGTPPDKLLSADNGAGVVGDTQQIITTLGAGQSVRLPLLFGIGSRQPFSFFFDVYTILPGAALTANAILLKPQIGVSALSDVSLTTAADTAVGGTPVPLGHFQLQIDDGIPPASPPNSSSNGDPLSNEAVITGSGPYSRPAVAVDPIIPTHIAVAANDYATRTVRVSTSQDGGFTWHATALGLSVLGQDFGTAENPSLAFDSRGRLSVVYTLADPFDSANAIVISESSDGINFSPPSAITFHTASEQIADSRPVIAIGSGDRYVAWDTLSLSTLRFGINLVRSEQSGAFGPVTSVVSNGLVSSPVLALSESRVYIGWDDWGFNSSPPYNSGGRLMITSSPQAGKLHFDAPLEIARTSIGFARKIPAMPEKGVGPSLSLAVDPRREDAIYAVFADIGNGMDIFFARSTNQGKKWQIVTTVNDDKSAADQFSPSIAVDVHGRINVSFYDTRLSSTFQTTHVFLGRSADGNAFTNERVTNAMSNDSASNPFRDYTANLGDRTAIAITDGDTFVAWTDTRLEFENIFASIVFNPFGAFVTGAGKIVSPAGAYSPNPALTGTAEFGFVFKYRTGSSVPVGSTEFNFAVPKSKFKFKFQSTSYDSLLIRGATAQFKGSGKINGAGDYSFVVTVTAADQHDKHDDTNGDRHDDTNGGQNSKDGEQTGGGGRFRIKIVDSSGGVIYDNVPGAPDTATPEAITEGEIQIVKQ
jgi:Putative Ig domain